MPNDLNLPAEWIVDEMGNVRPADYAEPTSPEILERIAANSPVAPFGLPPTDGAPVALTKGCGCGKTLTVTNS